MRIMAINVIIVEVNRMLLQSSMYCKSVFSKFDRKQFCIVSNVKTMKTSVTIKCIIFLYM